MNNITLPRCQECGEEIQPKPTGWHVKTGRPCRTVRLKRAQLGAIRRYQRRKRLAAREAAKK